MNNQAASRPLRHQAYRAAISLILLITVWIAVIEWDPVGNIAYLLLPLVMASPFLLLWALIESLTLGWALWLHRRRREVPNVVALRRRTAFVVAVAAAASLVYVQWHDQQQLDQWYLQHASQQNIEATGDRTAASPYASCGEYLTV